MINDLTPSLNLPLPHPQNNLEDDVTRLRESLIMLDTVVAAKADDSDVADAITGKADKSVAIVNKTAAYTVVAGDLNKIINCTSGTFTVALAAAATLGSGFSCWVWNTATSAAEVITIDPNASETIDGVATLTLRRGEGLQVICDGVSLQTGSKRAMRGYADNMAPSATRPVASKDNAIALGTSAIASGVSSLATMLCTASSDYSVAIGRNSGGTGSQAVSGNGAMALGGSYASGIDSFAAAIGENTTSYGATGTNSVAIGYRAKATGQYTAALGGYSNIASGSNSTVCGGFLNTASGDNSVVIGGVYGVAAQYGKQAFASGRFASAGDAQAGRMVLRRQLTSGSYARLASDGGTGTGATMLTLPDDSTFIVRGQVVARNTASDTDSMCWEFKCAIRRGAGAASVAFIGSPVIDLIASDGSAWVVTLAVNTYIGCLEVRGTGDITKTINWVCTLDTTEVTG